ncbi:restriction endonuclease subunit S [Planctobacterium marinum]|uniref:Type I restriction modification DNA specificity domain-containing protein n=1 Tax=Planctobacterium marinum TaxID=1631968 RepID=A0AA48KU04_9ALTE|nr:hypothetical protein MACH26_36100 [Planctobacterium marinum]
MSWPKAKLSEVAPAKPLRKIGRIDEDHVLQITLDHIESESGRLLKRNYAPVSEAGSSTHWFDNRYVLYSKLRPYLNKVYLPDELGIGTTELVPMLPNDQVLDRKYLAYFLRSKTFVDWVSSQTAGAKMPRVSMKVFWDYEIPLPPLAEQERIAAILDKADAIRRKRQQTIQLADDFLRAVFLDMFGDPVTNPKGWDVKTFGELGTWASGGTPSRKNSDYFEGDINWYSARELNHRYLSGSIEKITDTALKNSAAKIFPEGSMLVGMYDTAAFKISILREPSASNQACANIIPGELLDIEWFYSFIEFSKETYLRQRRGVRQKNLNLGMIKDFELPLPPIEEQRKFKVIAEKLLNSKLLQVHSAGLAIASFSSLSQKAFSGGL